MDIKKVDELVRMKGNCAAATEVLTIELLSTIANGVARLVQIEEDKISGQMSFDLKSPAPAPKAEVQKAPEPVKAPAPKKKAETKPAEVVAEKVEPVKTPEPVEVVAEKVMLTKGEIMPTLVAYIKENGEPAFAKILKSLGNYATFPEVPQEQYEDLLNAIN